MEPRVWSPRKDPRVDAEESVNHPFKYFMSKTLHQLNIEEVIAWHEHRAHDLNLEYRKSPNGRGGDWREDRDRHERFCDTVKKLRDYAEESSKSNMAHMRQDLDKARADLEDLKRRSDRDQNQDAIEAEGAERV